MFIYLSKKIAIPNNTHIRSLSWTYEHGYIACGGDDGLLKVLKLDMGDKEGKIRGLAAPSNLSMNQTLEGHSGMVQVVTWNEPYQKLTSSDQTGLIIVWMLYKGSWYEEMINNRNKSVVRGMAWNADGQKICIVYEDGAVIVGSVDGNRIWGKELKGTHLTHVEWSPDGKLLLFGIQGTEIHVYDQNGNFMSRVLLPVLQPPTTTTIVSIHWYNGVGGASEPNVPTLAISFDNGRIQLMKNESDDDPIIIDVDLTITSMRWNYNGTILAVTGKQYGGDMEKKNVVKFYNATGQHLHTLRVPGKDITCCSWEKGGLRIALAVDSYIFFANIRPDYKWCYFANTVAYAFNKTDRIESSLMFWNIRTKEKYVKYVKHLLGMTAGGEFCVLSTKTEDANDQYALIVCNAIGTPIDSRYISIEPCYIAMTNSHIFAASKDYIYVWHFHTPKGRMILDIASQKAKSGQERLFHVDETPSGVGDGYIADPTKPDKRMMGTRDPICCIAASEKIAVVGRESGAFQRYTVPQFALTHRYSTSCRPSKIALNCFSSRLSIIDISGALLLYDLDARTPSSSSNSHDTLGQLLNFERRDVWDVKWASDNSEMFAAMEKTRMYIFRDIDPEEPVLSSGYLCSFEDLQVRTVLLDEIMQDGDNPTPDCIVDFEVKSLRDSRDLLEKVGIAEASQFIEDNSHPRLWRLLAEAALQKMDFPTAETAFVRCKDYKGIEFVKRISNLQNETMRKAEVAAYFKQFDEAEKLYLDMDRKDQAIALRRLLGDWFRVVQLLKGSITAGDDRQLQESWNAIGDYYADRQKWENAVTYYEQGQNQERLAECYYMLEDYTGLESLLRSLPENHKLLVELGGMFASVGMCEQAVEAYLKAGKVKEAIDCCVTLNEWNTAIDLAQKNDIQDIDSLLSKYAQHLMDKKKILNVVELYKKANKFLDAANVMFKESKKENSPPLRLKKLYILAALLVEKHQEHLRQTVKSQTKSGREAASALNALLDDEAMSFTDTKLVDRPWKGAEAYHFLLLAQRQLYEGYVDAAMKTALHLRDYEDILNQEEVYALLALTSCANRAFGTCSKAFIKLESLDSISPERRDEYADLAMDIFMKHPPKDSRTSKAECTNCETMIPDWCPTCPSCNAKFPICIATGRPIMDSAQQWTCKTCKHSAYKSDMVTAQLCPLCHTAVVEAT